MSLQPIYSNKVFSLFRKHDQITECRCFTSSFDLLAQAAPYGLEVISDGSLEMLFSQRGFVGT